MENNFDCLLLLFLLVLVLVLSLVLILLVLLLPHAQGEVIPCLVVRGIISQALLVCLNGIREQLVLLTGHADVMPHLRLSELGSLTLCRVLQLCHGRAVLLLHEQCRAQVVQSLWVRRILAQGLPVFYLRLGIVLLAIQPVTISDKLPVALSIGIRECQHAHDQ